MREELMIRLCAPTLAALKTASLFQWRCGSREELCRDIRELNRRMAGRGIRALPMRWDGDRALLYLYRPDMLRRDLADPTAADILREHGYPEAGTGAMLAHLSGRLRAGGDFPHEIGLFLGYPAGDVRGFIAGDKPCKCTGLWKVYESDVEESQRMFRRCRRCTEALLCRYRDGWTLPELTAMPGQCTYNDILREQEREESA